LVGIVAADAEDAANGQAVGGARDGDARLLRGRKDIRHFETLVISVDRKPPPK
jgi:hypothetical protein